MRQSADMPLPFESNPGNDCGILCLQMIFANKIEEVSKNELSIENLRKRVGKTFEEGTNPGFMCKVLKEEGYGVQLFSTVDWNGIANNNPGTLLLNWDIKIVAVAMASRLIRAINKTATHFNLKKFQNSAKWLTCEDSKEIISNKNLSIKDMRNLLAENKIIIPIVKTGAHYVVVTKIDDEKVYFNHAPANKEPEARSKTHKDFMRYWSPIRSMRDAIVVG